MGEYVTALGDHAAEQAQLGRRHILMVNRDPALLDVVRVLLDEERDNVTTTNAVPLTFALIAAGRPALLIIDLELTQQHGWDLLVRLHAEARTAATPVIVTARDARLLAHADRYPDLYGADVQLVIPFSADAAGGDPASALIVTPAVSYRGTCRHEAHNRHSRVLTTLRWAICPAPPPFVRSRHFWLSRPDNGYGKHPAHTGREGQGTTVDPRWYFRPPRAVLLGASSP